VILVEGRSDAAAVGALATRLGRPPPDLVVLDGITNLPAVLRRIEGPVDVLVDRNEAPYAARHLGERGRLLVCVADLEDELRRALGVEATLVVIEATGELRSFHTLRQQPALRGWTVEEVLRRFMGSKSGRKERYGRLLVDALDLDRLPMPLARLLT
jgi:hypothetical protein